MPAYQTNDTKLEVPDGFIDRTVTRLDAKTANGSTISIMMHRTPLLEGQALADAVASHIRDAASGLRAHAVLENREAQVAGQPAFDIAMRWRDDDGMVYAREAHAEIEGTWLILTATGPLEERELCDSCFEYVIPTIQLKTGWG